MRFHNAFCLTMCLLHAFGVDCHWLRLSVSCNCIPNACIQHYCATVFGRDVPCWGKPPRMQGNL